MQSIAAYTGRSEASVGRDLDRWEERGPEGLADKTAPGNPTRVTEEVKTFMEHKLAEQRTWNATQLAEAVEGRFGIGVGPRPSVSTSWRWATRGSAPATCPPRNPTPKKSARPERSWDC